MLGELAELAERAHVPYLRDLFSQKRRADIAAKARETASVPGTGRDGPGKECELRGRVDEAVAGQPTATEFLKRLEARGVQPIPSVQLSGRWNGIVYRYQGQSTKGSALGRAYTAEGLQRHKGVKLRAGT